ncbi:amino acid permease [Taklimakanibacter deserti]|uniref:amino acid permease n=1 Tax=Taklimakanibacter deserti TaxID=2267839 RepID=UPI000E658A7B
MAQTESGGVSYKKADASYFEKRHLQRYAGIWSLWALGVGAVISGHFSGWNFGFATGGWGGMLVAGIIIAIMYIGLVFCIAEMSPALPHTGAAYSFGRTAMGPWGGFITGLCENVEYVVTPAVIAFFIGSYLTGIFETPAAMQPVWWIITYVVFLALNIFGVALSFRVTLIVTLLSLAVLVFFWFSAIPNMDFSRWALNIAPDIQSATVPLDALKGAVATLPADIAALVTGAAADATEVTLTAAQYGTLSPELQAAAKTSNELANGNGPYFPFGFSGVLATLPFAVWLFLAIEQLPLAAEESVDPKRDMPKGILLGMLTLVVSAFMIVLLNPAVIGVGAHKLGTSGEPLLDGFRAIFGGVGAKALGLIALVGLIASFHTIVFAMGRQVYSLSRAGYFPKGLSITHDSYKTPYIAMIVGALVGLAIMLVIWFALGENAGSAIGVVLLNMAVFGAMFSYILQAISFILLRKNQPHIERPYVSPLGIPGAVATIIIGLVTLYYQIWDPLFYKGVFWVGVWFIVAIIYFAAVGRHKLILSPEEEFAMEHRAKA